MSDTTRAEVRYEDRERRLTFAWSGGWDEPVHVLEQGDKPLDTFMLPVSLATAARTSLTTSEWLELVQLACRAWRPEGGTVVFTEPVSPVPSALLDELNDKFDQYGRNPESGLWAAVEAFLDGVRRG